MTSQTKARKTTKKPVSKETAPVSVETECPPEPKPWTMPTPQLGQTVLYYHRSTVSKANTDIAFVSSIGESSIAVQFRGTGYDEVMHIDDPRLKANPDLRHDIHGVWDYTDQHKRMEARIAELESRIEALETSS